MTMRPWTRTIRRILPSALIALTGCFSLSRPTPSVRHFVLGRARPPEVGAVSSASIAVGLRRLQLASYLETTFIVVRWGAQRVTFAESDRWGENLGEGINHALADYLAGRAPFARLDVAPWPIATQHDYLIQLRVLQFEGVAPEDVSAQEGEARVLATWQIIRQQDGEVVGQGTTDFRKGGWTIGDYAGLVALLDSGLDALAADLATGLEKLAAEP
jgi:uncharacterized lipoprotein YmbA